MGAKAGSDAFSIRCFSVYIICERNKFLANIVARLFPACQLLFMELSVVLK